MYVNEWGEIWGTLLQLARNNTELVKVKYDHLLLMWQDLWTEVA